MTRTVVTGAGRGIGRATALACAAAGHELIVMSRNAAELDGLVGTIAAIAGAPAAVAVPGDVAVEADVERLMATAGGRIDVLVCAAGSAAVGPFEQLSLADWERTLAASLTGTFLCCKHAAPLLAAGGLIVALSSIAGKSGFPHWSAYSAAKFGVIGFTQAIREELRPRGIRVTTVIPGAVDTPLWDAVPGEWNRANMLRAEEVAQAILGVVNAPAHIQVDELTLGHVVGKL